MPRKKRPNPNATTGWDGEVRQDNIDNQVASEVLLVGKSVYNYAYGEAVKQVKEGKPVDEIRRALKRQPRQNPFQDPVTATRQDWHKIHEITESVLRRLQEQAVEDALTGRPSNYQPPIGY